MREWAFTGRVLEVINGRTVKVGIDLGFEVWKKIPVQLNRIFVNTPPPDSDIKDTSETARFLETHLRDKEVLLTTIRKKNRFKSVYYLAEIFIVPGSLNIRARDINLAINNPSKKDGYVNVSDVLVHMGLAKYS
jgi:hypothetical protein